MTPMGERPALAEAGGVRRASSNEVGRVTDVLTKAFADESIQKWCMACDDPTLLIGVEFLEAVRLLVGEGFLWVTADLGGRPCGSHPAPGTTMRRSTPSSARFSPPTVVSPRGGRVFGSGWKTIVRPKPIGISTWSGSILVATAPGR